MAGFIQIHLAVLTILLIADTLGIHVNVRPGRTTVINLGDTIIMHCEVEAKLEYCTFEFPDKTKVVLGPQKPKLPEYQYDGEGLDVGHCGIRIKSAEEKHNGDLVCAFGVASETHEQSGTMSVVITRKPDSIDMVMDRHPQDRRNNYYREGEQFIATCISRNGRPPANFTWFIGEQQITEGLSSPNITETAKGLFTLSQKITRVLHSSDSELDLKCVAQHPTFTGPPDFRHKNIVVQYPPKPSTEPLEVFGLVEGSEGKVAVVVLANPRPQFTWSIQGKELRERGFDSTGKYEVMEAINKGNGKWESVLVINTLNAEDVDKEYILTASNVLGSQEYRIHISTSPEPKVLEFGAGVIALAVISILVLLLVIAAIMFARSKGRWCFAHSSPRLAGESSDTESAAEQQGFGHINPSAKISFVSVFKKKGDKVAAQDFQKMDAEGEEEGNVPNKNRIVEVVEMGEGLVYAELDLKNPTGANTGVTVVRGEDDKTEYAEIIHTKPEKH